MSDSETPQLDELQAALDRGDLDEARRVVLSVDGREKDLLAEELGDDAFERVRSAAARGGRRGKLGRVIVLPGIMGTELDSVDAEGDADRIWIDYLRLIRGRISDLELTLDGRPTKPGLHVRPAGMHRKTYLPMLLELDTRWHVRPFPFDWREDIVKAADRLAGEAESFGGGDPVHLVAHSMGGLVSRCFIQRHRKVWEAMKDPTGQGRGGRLVMLGTPNRGSYAIPLTLTGAEKLVKLLAKADVPHRMPALLAIIGTFPGLYQMLPSPLLDLGDDHLRLFEPDAWGEIPARPPLLMSAQTFIRDLHDVIDADRLLYVAGYNRPTPARIRVDEPGRFSYLETNDGDGRVPHALGLLDGVTTYWISEIHGNLPKSPRVLDSITELLQLGSTLRLPTTKPTEAPAVRGAARGWVSAEDIAPVDPAIDTILTRAHARGAVDESELAPEDAIRLEDLAFAEYLGTGGGAREAAPSAPAPDRPPRTAAVEVVWGDVTRVEGDVYTVGHYEGVEPQRAELALDRLVSGVGDDADFDPRRLVITQHSRRGMVRGAVGDVSFFPSPAGVVAVAGMGRPGTFNRRALRQLARSLMLAVTALPDVGVVCSVLIGSGEGTLTVADAVRGLIAGVGEAVEELRPDEAFPAIKIVERERGRAEEILAVLRTVAEELRDMQERGRRVPALIDVQGRLKTAPSGTVSLEDSVALLAQGAVDAAGEAGGEAHLQELLERAPTTKKVRGLALAELRRAGGSGPLGLRVSRAPDGSFDDVAVRISFWTEGPAIKVAAIHSAATVAERGLTVGGDVVDELVVQMTDPRAEDVDKLCRLLYRLLVPTEFREVLHAGPLVFEVDREMAQVHWEMLAAAPRDDGRQIPLAVAAPLARQIRTQYSPAPLPPRRPRKRLRALVIGDPGDPDKGHDLPGARREALRVVELLRERSVDVEARIGAPGVPRVGALGDFRAADRLEVLGLLLDGGFDILHYAGHGDFDPVDPSRAGWLFATGLLTAGEIGRIEHVPSVVVANACLSGRTSQTLIGDRRTGDEPSEAGLLPSLADEFFHLGVRDYVGTAWEVNDIGAELFAEVFYETLLPRSGGVGKSLGEAVQKARKQLWDRSDDFGALWAAYQHYGDPTAREHAVRRPTGED